MTLSPYQLELRRDVVDYLDFYRGFLALNRMCGMDPDAMLDAISGIATNEQRQRISRSAGRMAEFVAMTHEQQTVILGMEPPPDLEVFRP